MRPARRRSPGADGRAICRAVRTRGLVEPVFVERVDDLADSLRGVVRDGDVVLTMGAGNIGAVAQDLKSRFAARRRGMSAQRLTDLSPEFAPRVLHDVPMSKHTSWHVGGPADFFFTPRDVMDLAAFVRQLPPDVPVLWIGLGSNLLVRDGGIRGAVIGDARRAGRARAPERHAHPGRGRRAVRAHRPAVREMGAGARRSSLPAFPAPWAARSP